MTPQTPEQTTPGQQPAPERSTAGQPAAERTPHTFQVDLRGLVDLLSHHLYSSPRVYLRELLQNGVDAVTARRAEAAERAGDPGDRLPQGRVRLRTSAGALSVEDNGIGLTEADVHSLLATIGRSSKREGLESARAGFLGQFGIGLLACFVVADSIRVVSRSARTPDAPPVEWTARDDGSYVVRTLPDDARAEPGTTVQLTARPGSEEWFRPERVTELARNVGSLLPYEVTVDGASIGEHPPVWERQFAGSAARRVELGRYCQRKFGFLPLDSIDLDVPVAGLRGVAFVLPSAVSPAQRAGHRVHLKGMLLTEQAPELLPDWAFFVRCVIDTDSLRPTASREHLYADEALSAVRDALGDRIKEWMTGLAAGDPDRLGHFLSVHHLGVKTLARHDPDLLRVMLPWLPFETTDGQRPLDEFATRHPIVHFTRTVEEYRQVAGIAAAQGIGVVNGGYTYDADLIEMLPLVRPGTQVAELDAETVTAHLDPVDPAQELALAGFLAAARACLDPLGCDVVLRAFHPLTLPALHLDDRAAQHERAREQAEEQADDLWAGILGSLRGSAPRARLVLNHLNPLVRTVGALDSAELAATAVQGLYGQALLMSQRPLRAADTALLNRAFLDLLQWATGQDGGPGTGRGDTDTPRRDDR